MLTTEVIILISVLFLLFTAVHLFLWLHTKDIQLARHFGLVFLSLLVLVVLLSVFSSLGIA